MKKGSKAPSAGCKSNAKPWRVEGDLRKWLASYLGDRLFWVEPAFGSTVGMPDACIVVEDAYLWAELKLAWVAGKGSKRRLRWTVRPAQKRTLRRLIRAGANVVWILALEGTRKVIVIQVSEATFKGEWPMDGGWMEWEA